MPATAEKGQPTKRKKRPPHLELIALRVNRGHSRGTLSQATGIGRETIRMAEAGWVPTPRVQFAIAKALDTTPLVLWPIERQRRPQ